MAHPVTWFQISGPDAEPLKTFYSAVFGWKLGPGPDGMVMVAADKGGIAGGISRSQSGAPSVTVYAETGDLEGTLSSVEAAGGHRAMPVMELPGGMGHIAGFLDPAGNWVGLWAPPKKPAARRAARKIAKKVKRSARAAKRSAKKAGKK
jgi:predicted enzyme related to lactoylglutathione lyase